MAPPSEDGRTTLPTLLVPVSVNQMFPSGPEVTSKGSLPAGNGYSLTTPPDVTDASLFVPDSATHSLLSAPRAVPRSRLPDGSAYSVTTPAVVILPTLLVL